MTQETFVAIGIVVLKGGLAAELFKLSTEESVIKFKQLCMEDADIIEAYIKSYEKGSDKLITTKFKHND